MRHGDLLEFERTVAANAALFKADKTYTLILRSARAHSSRNAHDRNGVGKSSLTLTLPPFPPTTSVCLQRIRLGHNVIKTGLRKISLSYSRISLADIATKLHLVRASALACHVSHVCPSSAMKRHGAHGWTPLSLSACAMRCDG